MRLTTLRRAPAAAALGLTLVLAGCGGEDAPEVADVEQGAEDVGQQVEDGAEQAEQEVEEQTDDASDDAEDDSEDD